ncbi:unnamed protein product [Mycena citricolor]|uniref:Uncharacterized protein n=1 Tax=Mycena citricolor TaxID=2018698 RepID=A0AAD2GX88_9AGAR|nr:unnamed protein product [Mycena citricolor]CAK5277731.1 unnamed protein product [Mycena citricolor]
MSRAETPEPSRLQGRRNVITEVQLLDGEGAISDQLELCLKYIFGKYCVPPPLVSADLNSSAPLANTGRAAFELRTVLPEGAYLTQEGLDSWAQDTNGAPFPQETKDELVEFLDVTDAGELTCADLTIRVAGV